MPKMLSEREKINRIIQSLPNETSMQLLDIYCPDEKIDPEQMTLDQLKNGLKSTLEAVKMTAEDSYEEEVGYWKRQIKRTESIIKKYQNWLNPTV
jgi:hypothetical protein